MKISIAPFRIDPILADVVMNEGHRLGFLDVVCVANMPTRDAEALGGDLNAAMRSVSSRSCPLPVVSVFALSRGSFFAYAWRELSTAERAWLEWALGCDAIAEAGLTKIRIPLVVNLLQPAPAGRVRVCLLDVEEIDQNADILPPRSFVPDEGWGALYRVLLRIGHPGCELRQVVVTSGRLTYRLLVPRDLTEGERSQVRSGDPSIQVGILAIPGVEGLLELRTMLPLPAP